MQNLIDGKGKFILELEEIYLHLLVNVQRTIGFGGFIAFNAKIALKEHYANSLGAERGLDNKMFIDEENAEILIDKYFKNG